MNKQLAIILRNKLTDLPFIDVAAGMVMTVTTTDTIPQDESGTNNRTITKRFPVATEVHTADIACQGKEISMIPNSAKRSILYFEDFGITVTGKLRGQTGFNSSLRLIFWMNRSIVVGDAYKNVSGRIMATIIDRLTSVNPENINIFTRLTVQVARIPPQDIALFGRYTYNETDRQILRPPFEFFGIDLTCKYYVPSNCLDAINWNVAVCD
jgi:hypothetical protein